MLALIIVLLQVQLLYVPLLLLLLRLTAHPRVTIWRASLRAVPLAWPLAVGIAGGLVSFAAYWAVAESDTELSGQLLVAMATAVWIATATQQSVEVTESQPATAADVAEPWLLARHQALGRT